MITNTVLDDELRAGGFDVDEAHRIFRERDEVKKFVGVLLARYEDEFSANKWPKALHGADYLAMKRSGEFSWKSIVREILAEESKSVSDDKKRAAGITICALYDRLLVRGSKLAPQSIEKFTTALKEFFDQDDELGWFAELHVGKTAKQAPSSVDMRRGRRWVELLRIMDDDAEG